MENHSIVKNYALFTANVTSKCTIHEVYIDPCKEVVEGKPCKIKRGITGNMTFHYTPSKYYYHLKNKY